MWQRCAFSPTLVSLALAQLQFLLIPGAGWGDNTRVGLYNQTAASFGSSSRSGIHLVALRSPSHGRQPWRQRLPWAQALALAAVSHSEKGVVAASDAVVPQWGLTAG